jgi:lysozyme
MMRFPSPCMILLVAALPLSSCAPADAPSTDAEDAAEESDALVVCPSGPELEGVDVSEFQGNIDWSAVSGSGIDFAFIRVSDGTGFPDSEFEDNWAGAKAVGLRRGAYQFFRPNESAEAQAQLMVEAIGDLGPEDLPPVVDVEAQGGVSDATLVARLGQWLTLVEQATGRRPIVYAASGFWNDIAGTAQFASYPLWVANYGVSCPSVPTTWQNFAFWQYTDSGSVPGISGSVDRNIFHGSAADLATFIEDSGGATPKLPVEVYWSRGASGSYALRALASTTVDRVEYRVDGFLIGAASRSDGSNFPDSYTFTSSANERFFEVAGFDTQERQVARGIGLIDVTPGTAVYIRQMGGSLYEVGLERAPSSVAAVEVRADGFLLTDSVSSTSRSTRKAVRSKFLQLGERDFAISTFNANGTLRGTLHRKFELE